MRRKTTLLLIFSALLCWIKSTGQTDTDNEIYFFEKVEGYLYSPKKERKKSKEYADTLKHLAFQENARAHYLLGFYQKEGLGTRQNTRKSVRSFKKAFELGHLEAGYCVGYYYLKGFGDTSQDYEKAYRWFKRSESSMGRHWMAKMNFFGLGREINKNKALRILRENNGLYNSKVLLPQFEKQDPPNNKTNYFEDVSLQINLNFLV